MTYLTMHHPWLQRATEIVASCLVMTDAAGAQSALSAAQHAAIAAKTAKLSKAELDIVSSWSDRQKLAEFFCSPLALAEFKKADKRADRVSLGPDEAGVEKFVLEGNRKLSGRGEGADDVALETIHVRMRARSRQGHHDVVHVQIRREVSRSGATLHLAQSCLSRGGGHPTAAASPTEARPYWRA